MLYRQRGRGVIGSFEGRRKVQRTRGTVFLPSIIIIQTIRDIGILLDLRQQNSTADGVNGSARDIKNVAGANGDFLQQRCDGTLIQRLFECFLCHGFSQTVIDIGTLSTTQDIPHFAFSGFFTVFMRHRVIGMDLNGERLRGINPFDQQGKIMHIPAVFSQQIFVGLHQKGAQCLSCKRAVCNDTFPIRVTGQFPCLRKSLIVKVLVETVLELVAAPQCRFTKWLQFDDGHVL